MSNITVTNLPVLTTLSGSSEVMVVQNGVSSTATAQQIANLNANGGTVTSVTAQSPLSGGTITTTGTIGVTDSSITNQYLSTMPANTIKGNNAAGVAAVKDLTAAQVLAMIGGGTVSSISTGTGLTGGPITTTGTISIANTGVTATSYGSETAVPRISVNAQGQLTNVSNVNILIPTSQITGLGTMATQNANAVAITGGTIDQTVIGGTTPAAGTHTTLTVTGNANFSTVASGTWNGTAIGVSYGGTGATTASGARTNLGAAASGANSDITSLTGLTTPLAETEGGTGYGSYTTGDILYASSSTTLARLNDVATGNALISGGVGVAPSYGKIGLTTHVSGTLPVANGGTGATTLTGYLVGNGTSAITAVSTIPNAGLTNSSITIGSTSVALGASTTTLAGLTTVTVTQDPTTSLQLSTKQYVDNQVATVSNTTFHTASAAATTANLTATYNNGTAGVGATLTNSGVQAAFAVDGYTASLNDRILVKDQTTGAQNGIYTVTTVGTILTNWVLTRATDFNTVGTGPNYIETGASTFINGGTTWGSTSWVMNTTGTITVGSTSLVWVQTSSSGNITVSAPITKTGNTIGLGTVGVANGGTGLTSLTAYAVLYAASTSSVGQISPSTTGYPLLSTGASTAPAFGQLSLTAGVTGTLPVGNGGTGTATTFTTGSVVFAGASGVYSQNNAKFFWDNTNNRLGINTATPQNQLTIVSNTQTTTPTGTLPSGTDLYIVGANAANTRITQDAYGTGAYGAYTGRQARGTAASPTATQSGDTLAQFTGRGYGATVFATASTGRFDVTAAENFTDTAQGTYASVFTTATGANSPTEAFRFGPAGQFGIGAGTYGTSGQFLLSGGASAAPTWTTVTLATLTGTVPVASGGTNITSYTVGDLIYASASTTLSKLADVATGSVLVSGGVGVAPAWSASPTVTALTTGSISNSGNTTNTGTGSRFLADFTNATITNRLAFQTSTTNSTTGIYALPNGTSTAASWQATNAADPTNASKVLIATNGSTDVQLVSGINGTGTYLPLSFYTNGTQAAQLDVSATPSFILGRGDAGATPSSSILRSPNGTGTNITGGNLSLYAGNGTGTGGSGYIDFQVAPVGTTGSTANTLASAMRITAAGNVGIGTTSPNAKLNVYSSSSTANLTQWNGGTSDANFITIAKSGTTGATLGTPQFSLGMDYSTTYVDLTAIKFARDPGAGGNMQFFTGINANGAERMRIDSSGNVGIGTSSPSYKLDVQTSGATVFNFQTSAANGGYGVWNAGTVPAYIGSLKAILLTGNASDFAIVGTGANNLVFGTNSAERMRIDSSGNVGIGTTSTYGSKMFVLGSANAGVAVSDNTNTIAMYGNGGTAVVLGTANSVPMFFTTGGTERMRISSTGGFSVGTTSDPGAGAIYATGNITAYFSDDRLKTRLGNIENALDKVSALNGFYYEPNETAQALGYKVRREVGVSAQDVQAILPEIVSPAPIDEQYLTIDYERIVPLLIEAIKELNAKIAVLEAK